MDKQQDPSYKRAKARVAKIKGFYRHLTVYILVNTVAFIFRGNVGFFFVNPELLENANFMNMIDWNTYGTAIIWGLFLIGHAVRTFIYFSFFSKKWEERKIQKYMKQDLE